MFETTNQYNIHIYIIIYIYTVMKIGKEKQHDLGLVPENPREYPETPVEFLKCSR